MPGLPVGPVELDIQDILMVGPSLVEHESRGIVGIAVEGAFEKIRLVPHRGEDRVQHIKEGVDPLGFHVEVDDIGNGHGGLLRGTFGRAASRFGMDRRRLGGGEARGGRGLIRKQLRPR